MLQTKQILAAGIIQDIEFISQYALDVYLSGLESKKNCYEILDKFERVDGSVIIRIVKSYNSSPLIKLFAD